MSLNVDPEAFRRAVDCLKDGGVIAYPTEGVYGLGCDPFNEQAVKRILELKQRSIDKGLILIAANWDQLSSLVKKLPNERMEEVLATWPGATTWLFPAKPIAPKWIKGIHESIAVRITDHIQAKELCEIYRQAIVSTSANLHGEPPIKDNIEVYEHFGEKVDYILPGRVGQLDRPTKIIDGLTGYVVRG